MVLVLVLAVWFNVLKSRNANVFQENARDTHNSHCREKYL